MAKSQIFIWNLRERTAIVYEQQAIQIAEEINDLRSVRTSWEPWQCIWFEAVNKKEKVCLKRTIEISKDIGDKVNLGIQLGNL